MRTHQNKLSIGFGAILVVLLALGTFLSQSLNGFIETSHMVEHTYKVLSQLEKVQAILLNAESGVRGYLLSGKESFLEPYNEAVDVVYQDIGRLKTLTKDNVKQHEPVRQLELVTRKRLSLLNQLRRQHAAGTLDYTTRLFLMTEGKLTTDKVWSILGQMKEEENRLLEGRESKSREQSQNAILFLALGAITTLGLLAGLYIFINAEMKNQAVSESRFRRLVDSNMLGVFFATLDGPITEANDALLSMLGYTRAELKSGKISWKELTPPEFEYLDKIGLEDIRKDRVNTPYEKQYIHKDGHRIDVLLAGALLEGSDNECVAFVVDLSNVKRLQKQSEKELADIQYALDESTIIAITDRKGDIIHANDGFCRISKYPREELMGQNHRIINSGYHPQEFFANMWKTISRGAVWKGEVKNRAKDGTYYWVDTTIVPTMGLDGKPASYVAIRSDITRLKAAEEAIRQFSVELEEKIEERTRELTNINSELEAFSYSVSHDLRAPLRSIEGFSQILLTDYRDHLDETGQNYLDRVRVNTRQMAQLIDDLLNLSRVTRGKMSIAKVDLSDLAHKIARELHEQEPERQGDFIISNDLVVNGDHRMLQAMLQNLMNNAWKFSRNREKAVIEFGAKQDNGTRIFYIKDNGAGFDMAYSGKLFGAFQRLHTVNEFAGTGIGLATVQRIVNRHGGKIYAEAEVDKGATFYFTL